MMLIIQVNIYKNYLELNVKLTSLFLYILSKEVGGNKDEKNNCM